ncbi:DHH family phosphoesterase [Prolixibacter denitrificans]|uniref:Phosphoesterase RecJ-like protein n=1 Tax=Prolixibacter denitrificans TaxID=1541063 RepID=A0A2P8CAT3_9BACT|nr:bifunctional oligoribonuclease/PAP phosphatase NrnA [Prolixibacter denitrificans]PSK82081.1 phosphoesterase RecJ-like protein [Prolixibacter denitrificans]
MKRLSPETIAKVKEVLSENVRDIVIIPHVNPDGDAVGSSLGLWRVLKNAGYAPTVISPTDYPAFLKWVSGTGDVKVYEHEPDVSQQILEKADLVFLLDFNAPDRAGKLGPLIEKVTSPIVLIDHHPAPADVTELMFSHTEASSTAELVYRFVESLDLCEYLDKDAAEALFTGLSTDTGSFSYNASSPDMYEVVSRLLEKGVDKDRIHDLIYNNFSADRMRLLGYSLDQKMKVFPEYHAAYISLSMEELERYNFVPGDTEGFVNYPLSIKGVIFTALFTEKEDLVKISFRSKGGFPTNEFSNLHFNGGGHMNASGGESKLSLAETIQKFEELLPEFSAKLKDEHRKLGN